MESELAVLRKLAFHLFSICPNSASYERGFSTLGWLFHKHRLNLSLQKLESMGKMILYWKSNSKTELRFYGVNQKGNFYSAKKGNFWELRISKKRKSSAVDHVFYALLRTVNIVLHQKMLFSIPNTKRCVVQRVFNFLMIIEVYGLTNLLICHIV